jgi:hypothetical protein
MTSPFTSPPRAASTSTLTPDRRSSSARTARFALAIGAGVSALAFVIGIVGLAVDQTLISGLPAWMKPTKFAFSITVYLLALRWMVSFVQVHQRLLTVIACAIAGALVVEIALVDLQVLRRTTSHFNEATELDALVFYAMGGVVAIVLIATIIAGILALRARELDPGLAAGIRWGIWVCILGMLAAVTMIFNRGWSDSGGHTVGAPDDGTGMLITGWSMLHGDLRIGHFVGLHALQVLPLLAWALARFTNLNARSRARLGHILGGTAAATVILLTWQALRGQSILLPDATTLVTSAVLAVAAATASTFVILRR